MMGMADRDDGTAPAGGTSTSGRRVDDRIWLALVGVALVSMVTIAIVTLVSNDVSAEVAAAVLAAGMTGAVSVVLAVVGLFGRQKEALERLQMRTADIQEREQIRREDATERTRMRHEDVVLRGLEYLTGKTQRRNVGIAILSLIHI